ncbi:MAG: hypothetical protein HOY79_07765 [Streptomyces sp.]|nr:hypothetical protein [Streptomyces sp.]
MVRDSVSPGGMLRWDARPSLRRTSSADLSGAVLSGIAIRGPVPRPAPSRGHGNSNRRRTTASSDLLCHNNRLVRPSSSMTRCPAGSTPAGGPATASCSTNEDRPAQP